VRIPVPPVIQPTNEMLTLIAAIDEVKGEWLALRSLGGTTWNYGTRFETDARRSRSSGMIGLGWSDMGSFRAAVAACASKQTGASSRFRIRVTSASASATEATSSEYTTCYGMSDPCEGVRGTKSAMISKILEGNLFRAIPLFSLLFIDRMGRMFIRRGQTKTKFAK
jgi:hypothetical protein